MQAQNNPLVANLNPNIQAPQRQPPPKQAPPRQVQNQKKNGNPGQPQPVTKK